MTARLQPARVRIAAGIAAALALVLIVVLALFPWGVLRGVVERRASARLGRPVTIASAERVDTIGFHPVIAVRGLRVPQAGWAGRGDLAVVDEVRMGFSVWPLLLGRFAPEDVRVRGMRLALVRAADGRTNWRGSRDEGDGDGGGAGRLKGLTITDGVVGYRDAKQDRAVRLRVAADPDTGLRAFGTGMVRGAAVRLAFAAPPVSRDGPWPLVARIDGADLAMRARGTMDRPLDTGAMTLDVAARAADLKLIDAVIEAGLFRTRAVTLGAHVRHDRRRWTITGLSGTIGRSRFAGRLNVDKGDERTRLDGDIRSDRLDFADLSSAEGRAAAAALERRTGPRLVPATRIDIGKIDSTDGTIRFRIGRVVSADGPSAIRSAAGTMTIDHTRLTVAPLRLALAQGVVTGRAVVDQRGGRRVPVVTLDLRLGGASVMSVAGGAGDFTGRIAARAVLTGPGETIRAAVGGANGHVGFVVRDGQLPQRYAAALGFDAGRALLARADQRAGLRCVVLDLAVRDGIGRVAPLVIDTDASQSRGTGTVRLGDERIALRLTGAPKHGSLLRLPGAVTMTGTIQRPELVVPSEIRSAGNIFKAIGRAIRGTGGPDAGDADCATLAARALR